MHRARAIFLAALGSSIICSPAAAEWSIPGAAALREIAWNLTKPRVPWRAINKAARQRIGAREVIAYRGFSAKVDNFDLMSYLDIDSPKYNCLTRRKRLAEIRRRWKRGGLVELGKNRPVLADHGADPDQLAPGLPEPAAYLAATPLPGVGQQRDLG